MLLNWCVILNWSLVLHLSLRLSLTLLEGIHVTLTEAYIITAVFQTLHKLILWGLTRIILLLLHGLRSHLLRSSLLFMATTSSEHWSNNSMGNFWTGTKCHTLSHCCSKAWHHTSTLWLLLHWWWGMLHRSWWWGARCRLRCGLAK